MKTFLLEAVGPRTTDVPHPGASTLIGAPRSYQLGHQFTIIDLQKTEITQPHISQNKRIT